MSEDDRKEACQDGSAKKGGGDQNRSHSPDQEERSCSDNCASDHGNEDKAGEEEAEDKRSARDKASDWLRTPSHKLIALAVVGILIVCIVVGILWWLEARKWKETDNAYVRGPIARLSPGVSGNVTRVFVVSNQVVKAGQPLAAISVGSYDVAVRQAEAEHAVAEAAVLQADAALVTARAQVRQSAAVARARDGEATVAARDFDRYASLSEGAVAEVQRDRAAAQANSARETAIAADETTRALIARVNQARADIAAAQARVQQTLANLTNAKLRRGDAIVLAPISGRVTQFDIEPGDYIAPGQPLAAIVGHARWVEANFKEDQLRLMRPGQPVELRIEAWSEFPLEGYVESFQAGSGAQFSALPPQNATGNWVKTVQRVPVKIRFREDAFRNFPARADIIPGLSVNAAVKVMR